MSPKSYRLIFASHTSTSSLSKGNLGLYVIIYVIIIITIGTSVCDKNHSVNINITVMAMAQCENRGLLVWRQLVRVHWATIDYSLKVSFHNVFSIFTKNLCWHSSLVPRPRIKAFVLLPNSTSWHIFSRICQELQLMKISKMIKWSRSSKIMQNVMFHFKL